MAHGAPSPRGGNDTPQPTPEQKAAMELAQALKDMPPFDTLVECRSFNVSLLQLPQGWALVFDTPQRVRYAFPMGDEGRDGLSRMLTESKLAARPGERPPDLRGGQG